MTFSDLLQFYHKIRNMFRYFKISMRSCFSNWTPMNVHWCVHDACIMPVTWLQHLSGSFTVVSAPIDQTILSKIAVGQDLSILCSEFLMDFCQWQLRGSLSFTTMDHWVKHQRRQSVWPLERLLTNTSMPYLQWNSLPWYPCIIASRQYPQAVYLY